MILNDNTTYKKEDLNKEIPKIIEIFENKKIDSLREQGVFIFPNFHNEEKDVSGLVEDNMVFKLNDGVLSTCNAVGFLACGDERLIIKSRFSNDDCDYFFRYLIEKVFRLSLPNVIEQRTEGGDPVYEMLLFLFPYYLKKAMRKGIYKMYIRKEYNDANIKGAIDFSRHMKVNMPFMGKVSYTTREFSIDNYLTELIRHTIEFIKQTEYGNSILRNVDDEIKMIINGTRNYDFFDRKKIIRVNKEKRINHSFYNEYKDLQRLCIKILEHSQSGHSNNNEIINGIIFDCAWLWEEYINLVIGDYFHHPRNKGKKEERNAQNIFLCKEREQGEIYPDFIGKKRKEDGYDVYDIADCKYKPFGNIRSSDYHQICTYMFRFGADRGIFIYPEIGDKKPIDYLLLKGNTFQGKDNVKPRDDKKAVKYSFNIPQVEDYNKFKAVIEKSEKDIKEYLKK